MVTDIDWGRVERGIKRLATKHARETGRAITAWNILQETLGVAFAEIATPSTHDIGLAIWYSQDSDRNQRKLLIAAAITVFGATHIIYKELKWICARADSCADDRNNITHVRYAATIDDATARPMMRPSGIGSYNRADQMANRDIFIELSTLEKNCNTLTRYLYELLPFVAFPDRLASLPERPELLKSTVRQNQAQEARGRQKKRPPHPPRSSRE